MKLLRSLAAALIGLAAPLATAEPAGHPGKLNFLRSTDSAGALRNLQTASVAYRPAHGGGPTVWLVGVAHLGTREYFQGLQQRLDRATVVLYEGVGISDVKKGPGAATDGAGVQAALAKALGLSFQLDVIDYRRSHFLNSDLQVPELQDEVRKHPTTSTSAGSSEDLLNQLMDTLQGTGLAGTAMNQLVGVLGASPQMRETTKLMLVEVLSQAGELLQLAKTFSPEIRELFEVLLTQRNAIVLRDLRAQLGRLQAGESVAVFYGAAHMDEIAEHLRTDLGYVPSTTQWATAFTASPAQSGINSGQIQLMLNLLRSQLQPAK